MKASLTLLAVLICVTQTFSQSFGMQWASRYNGPANNADWAYAVATDNSGNVYVTGYSNGQGTGKDLLTIKYNSIGLPLWTARYNGPVNGGDYSFAICLDQQGNVYITGRSDRGPQFLSDYTTIKYDNNGVQQWVALYDGPDHNADEAKAICVDNSGNVYVTGKSYSITDFQNITTVKYNSAGVQQWVCIYNGAANGDDVGNSMALDAAGNVYVTGGSVGASYDFVTLKINTDGTIGWEKRYNGPASGGDVANSLKIDQEAGYVYVTGFSYGDGNTSYDFATLKYDLSGNQLWVKRFNGEGSRTDIANAMALDMNGNIYVTGATLTTNGDLDTNFATVKYNPNGVLQWVMYYARAGMASDVSRAIVTDNENNVYVTGNSGIIGLTDDYTTIKYNSDGEQLWIFTYNGPDNNNDNTSSIAVNNSGDIFVTGRSFSIVNDYDYVTLKYSNLVGLHQTGTTIPKDFSLYQNYPNPFNPATKIKFDLAQSTNVGIVMYNSLGAVVKTENFGIHQAGKYEYLFDASAFSSGVYFYKLIAGDFTSTKKMILVK